MPRRSAESDVLTRLHEIAIAGAPAAMELMVNIVNGTSTVPRDRIDAAKFILEHVAGRAVPKATTTPQDQQMFDLLAEIRDIRHAVRTDGPDDAGLSSDPTVGDAPLPSDA